MLGTDMTTVVDEPAEGWRIHLLGEFDVEGPDGRVEVPPAAARVVAYLAIQGHPVRRTIIAGTIWPDVDEARAQLDELIDLARGGIATIVDGQRAYLATPPPPLDALR